MEAAAFGDGDALQVHGIVGRCLEALRLEVQRVHHLLGLGHTQVRGGCLEHVPGIAGGEAQHLLSVHYGFSKAEGQLGDAFIGLLVADGVEIDAPDHAGQGGEEVPLVLGTADFLEDDRHLLFRDHVGGGGYIGPGRGEVHRGVHALDGLCKQPQLLVLILHAGEHIGGIHSCKRLVIRVFQLGRGTHGKRGPDLADKHAQRVGEILGQGGGYEFREDLVVGDVGIDHIVQAVLLDEAVEVFGAYHEGPRNQDLYVFPVIVQSVPVKHTVKEGQAACLAAYGTFAEAGEPDAVVVGLRAEPCYDSQSLDCAVAVDRLHGGAAEGLGGGVGGPLEFVSYGEYTSCKQPAGKVILGPE